MSISQSSMDVRLQKLICCIGTLAGEVGDALFIGGCYEEKLKKLKLLIGFLEALECYNIDDTEILATGTITLSNLKDSTINILINGISISGSFNVIGSDSLAINYQNLVNQINNYQTSYIANFTLGDSHITITGKCSNDILSATTTTIGLTITTTGLSGGYCSGNCLTEEQVLNMFETASEYCGICYPASDYQFTNSKIE